MHGTPALPRRRIVATFDTFLDAQSTIERLTDADLGAERATILAEGLRLVGRPSAGPQVRPTVTLGAITGLVVGVLLAWAYGLVAVPAASLPAVVGGGLLIGLVVGSASGWLTARIVALRRDPSSRTGLDAERFSVVVDEEVAERAVRILRLTVAGSRPLTALGGTRPWAAAASPGPDADEVDGSSAGGGASAPG